MASGGGGVKSQNVRVRVQHAERACARRTLLVRAQILCSKRTAYAAGPRSARRTLLVRAQILCSNRSGLSGYRRRPIIMGKWARSRAGRPTLQTVWASISTAASHSLCVARISSS